MAEGQKRRLESWKEIASFFNRDERTVRRWERLRGLPVHRIPGGERNLVFAYQEELERWLAGDVRDRRTEASAAAPSADLAVEATTAPASRAEPDQRTPRLFFTAISSRWRLAAVIVLSFAALGFAALGVLDQRSLKPSRQIDLVHSGKPPYEPSPEARDLYLTGVYHLGTRQSNGLTRAIQYFTEATIRDPHYAVAYAKLADAYNTISQFTLMPADEAYPRAKAAAERAIALDPDLADAYASLAFTEFYWSRNFTQSQELFERAIALDPSSAQTRHWYALTLMHSGRFDIPLREITKAQEINPESRVISANKALILFHAGRSTDAVTILRQLADAEPNLRAPPEYLATIYLSQQRYQDFLREYRTAAEMTKNNARIAIATAAENGLRSGGERGLLEAMLAEQKRQYALGSEPVYKLAVSAALLGDIDLALQYLEESIRRQEQDILGILIDPAFKAMQGTARYRQLVDRVGFASSD
ncbi:hypothetical protein OZ411_23085 [Bradyrhizobium sp. Arg237L]|uniref:tetratricopeptide repeat protein n=1 Tax=Bradyrhizobium sp. Arg237L TaxID=3003352 RepID=UPI00249DA18D|nr:hypothetical protein [Bradyrhizobium sp. Arg237L]MDI4235696.1 hypothetical protein [Bradyrhizobium sp. Arg237L]